MTKTVSALFDSYASATSAVSALEAAGVPHAEISIVANKGADDHAGDHAQETADDAGKGATIGTVLGGTGGLLAGLGMLAIPGVGPVVAAGWLVATAVGAGAGAALGAAAGGIVGSMTAAGVPERDAHVYAEGVRRGGTLVSARVDDSRATEAQSILDRSKSVNIEERGNAYRQSGWASFDPKAPEYTSEQIAQERTRYPVA